MSKQNEGNELMDAEAEQYAVDAGMATHAWDMFEAQHGDLPFAVDEAIRAGIAAALASANLRVATEAIAEAISYAEDQAMAGAYFPEWQNCADLLRSMCVARGIHLEER
jgi:hypothetical protein